MCAPPSHPAFPHEADHNRGLQAASAVLCYGSIEVPFAQPRALLGGHFIASLVGVCIYKLFALSRRIDDVRWAAASLACALARSWDPAGKFASDLL